MDGKTSNHSDTTTRNMQNISVNKYVYPIDIEEAKKSNILVTGTNQQGKTRLAMALCDVLMREGWQVLVFDSVGIWKTKSSIPHYFDVSEKTMKFVITDNSLIYDISKLLPFFQREYLEAVLSELWNYRIEQQTEKWLLIVTEEAHLYMRFLRGLVSQNLMRFCSVGANWKTRILAISPSLTGLDSEFIRLCQQRYHFKLGNELNAKRRFRGYYSKDMQIVGLNLNVGCFLYYLNGKLTPCCVPLFVSDTQPQPIKELSWFKRWIYNGDA